MLLHGIKLNYPSARDWMWNYCVYLKPKENIMLLHGVKLNYPSARDWMWNYCVYLGPFEYEGQKYDLGVYHHVDDREGLSAAVVYGDEPGDYISGPESISWDNKAVQEAFRRAHLIGL